MNFDLIEILCEKSGESMGKYAINYKFDAKI